MDDILSRRRNILLDRHGVEEIGDAPALLFRCGVDEPHHEKKCHHGCYKIGVSDLPTTTVMAALHHFKALDNDLALVLATCFRHSTS